MRNAYHRRLIFSICCGLLMSCGVDKSDSAKTRADPSADSDVEPPWNGGESGGNGNGGDNNGTGGAGSSSGAGAVDSEEPPLSRPSPDSDLDDGPDVVANPFVVTAQDPFSTFGADVDTASYDLFRQSVINGSLPAATSVRVEDFVNYFDYDYPTPAADATDPFAISLVAAAHPMGRSTTLLRVGIQAKAAPAEQKPANIVFLVDVSGSMAGVEKLPLVKVVLKESLSALQATDTVSIVSYASDTRVRLKPTAVSDAQTITAEIDKLEAGGGTNGASGIQLAYEQAAAGLIKGGINHVVLCTDGDFNLGQTSDEALVQLIRDKRQTGVTLTALGFGRGNLNDSMMEKVSNAGNGIYSVVYSRDQAIEYANERMLSTLVHVAKDMKIQVELNPALVTAYRLIGYENRAIADDDFRDDSVDGGEVGAGHRVTALYELVLTGGSVPMPKGAPALLTAVQNDLTPEISPSELVRVKVRYKQVDATDANPAAEVVQALTPEEIALEANDLGEDFSWVAAVGTLAEILRGSPYASSSELGAVTKILDAQKTRDSDRGELASLMTKVTSLLQQRSKQ